MPAQTSIENNFVGGLKTEFTGLNFPENACTDVDNCVFSLVGDVNRRFGFDYEVNNTQTSIDRTGKALSTYKWNNAGGDGTTQIVVEQVGNILYFYRSSTATTASPLSTQVLSSTVDISGYLPSGSSADPSIAECQYTDGNGYLFVFHPNVDAFYCSYTAGMVASNSIQIQTRDFNGVVEASVPVSFRPPALSNEHNYNLLNQGWTAAPIWGANSTTMVETLHAPNAASIPLGNNSFTVQAGISGIVVGTAVTITGYFNAIVVDGSFRSTALFNTYGNVISYSGTTLVINVTSTTNFNWGQNITSLGTQAWSIVPPAAINTISAWNSALGNYPSNADVWWTFKDDTDAFAPATTVNNVSQVTSQAAQGHFILSPFNWNQSGVSGISSITNVSTTKRSRTGVWFQGRVFYTGVDDSQAATGDQQFYTWTESIYFSQIIENASQLGMCYQENDPTSETLFGELPSDGGVIVIQGSGAIYKLFPIQNGLLVFGANGIWFITGSQGIGFTANDYTVTKISGVRAFSGTSFVNVNGMPVFWNEEGIYTVELAQQGGLSVNPITVGTIQSFYNSIPLDSRKYARGDYNPIDYVIQWVYRSTQESDVTSRYEFDSILSLNTYNKAFAPYTFTGTPKIHGVIYVSSPGGSTAPDPIFKYPCSAPFSSTYKFTFADEHDTSYLDWVSYDTIGVDFTSYFVTGYKLHGQALRQWQPTYVYMYSNNEEATSYRIQGIWNYATSGNSGKYSSIQLITNDIDDLGFKVRRHRIRGHGTSLQLKVISVTGEPFHIIGWAIWENSNQGI